MKKESMALWALPIDEVFSRLKTARHGLSTKEADARFALLGKNQFLNQNKRHWLDILISQFNNPLGAVLVFAAAISIFLGEGLSTAVILCIIIVNSLIGFYQELKAEKTIEELEKYVKLKSRVLRDGKLVEIDANLLVPGDIVRLEIGDIIPADIRLFEVDEMMTDEAALTGESIPVIKKINIVSDQHSLPQYLHNMAFTGTNVSGGYGLGVVTAIGKDTFFGKTASLIGKREVETAFHKGVREFGKFSLRIVLFMTGFIFMANALLGKPFLESFLFALALAVGITPEMLPIIITITLSHGAMRMAKEKVIVKNLEAIEDLGNIDVLCCDKTGTLTEGALSLHDYIGLDGSKNDDIILYGLLCNSAKERDKTNPLVNPIDKAIWEHPKAEHMKGALAKYKLLDENAFDFTRKKMSVLVQAGRKKILIAKGSAESIISSSSYAMTGSKKTKIDKRMQKKIAKFIEDHEEQGYRVIAVAIKETAKKKTTGNDETGMTFIGLLLVLDPPRASAKKILAEIQSLGISIKIITGDSPIITKKICSEVGLKINENRAILGDELEAMPAEELKRACDKYNVFCRVTPEQKYIIVTKLQEAGHEVGFLGDGINDAPALKAATVGITVDTAAGIAKEAADIILLKRDLGVIAEGVKQGRKTFGNITKYIMNTLSANYGNMITVALSSLLLSFIPLRPSQILLNNLASDIPLLTIPSDNVDKDVLQKPKKWDIVLIENFMIIFGLISTFFDLLLILALIFIFHAEPALFRTAWFVESSLSEILVTFAIRTRYPLLKSRPSIALLSSSLIVSLGIITIAYSAIGGTLFEFVSMPFEILVLIFATLACYFATAEIAKHAFFKQQDGKV